MFSRHDSIQELPGAPQHAPFPTAPSRVAYLPEYFMYCNYLKRLGTRQTYIYIYCIYIYIYVMLCYFSPCSVSFVPIGEYIQYSPIIPSNIHLQLIIPSNIHLQCLCSTKNEKKQHHEGNMALRIISILTH